MTVEDAKVLKEKLAVLAKVSGARLELLTTTLYMRGAVPRWNVACPSGVLVCEAVGCLA